MSPRPRSPSRRRLRLLVLTHPELVPPAASRVPRPSRSQPPWATEHEVRRALEARGHEVSFQGVEDDLVPLDERLDALRPDLVVNLLEEFDGLTSRVAHVVAHLEALAYPVTGCSAQGLFLAHHKGVAKDLLAANGVAVARGFVVSRGATLPRAPALPFPLVVKAADEHGSAGLSGASLVRTRGALATQVRALHRRLGADALVETYVEGREVYLTVLGGPRPRVLPPRELRRRSRPRSPWLLTERIKWSPAVRRRLGLRFADAAPLPGGAGRRLARQALAAYRALRLAGLARVDFRLPAAGDPVVLEVNANPDLHPHSDAALSAAAAGLSYGSFLDAILGEALARG